MKKILAARVRKQEGATAVEYGLIAGLIAVGIAFVLVTLGPKLSGVFESVETSLTPTK